MTTAISEGSVLPEEHAASSGASTRPASNERTGRARRTIVRIGMNESFGVEGRVIAVSGGVQRELRGRVPIDLLTPQRPAALVIPVACSGRHGAALRDSSRRTVERAGFTLVDIAEASVEALEMGVAPVVYRYMARS